MEANEILMLRTVAYGLAEIDKRSDGASFDLEAARRLGNLILSMISDNQRMADVGLLYGQMRKDFALLEGRAEKVSKQCAELIQERDSLRHQTGIADVSLESLLKERQSLIAERDSLAAQLDLANRMLLEARGERDSCLREIEGMRKSLAVGDAAVIEPRRVQAERESLGAERDALKRKVGKLKDIIAAFPDDVVGGGVA